MPPRSTQTPSSDPKGRVSRRRLPLLVGGLAALAGTPRGAAGSTSGSSAFVLATIAEIQQVALPAMPLEVHVARVVLPAGVSLPSATPNGVRLLAVTAGTLTVGVASTAPSALLARETPPGRWVIVPAGRSIALDASAIVGVGNGGARPAVILDAAVFGGADRTPDQAFTTDAGVGFQVLAGGAAGLPPVGRCTVALSRSEIAPGHAIDMDGMALVYAESGTGWALATRGEVGYARAAGQAPGSSAGPWRAVRGSREAPLTAGSALLLGSAGSARIGNAGRRSVRLLLVTVRPDPPKSAPADAPDPDRPYGTPAPEDG